MIIKGKLVNVYYHSSGDKFKLFFVMRVKGSGAMTEKVTVPWQPGKPYAFCTADAIGFLKKCFESVKAPVTFTASEGITLGGKKELFKFETTTPDKIGAIKKLSLWQNNIQFNNNSIYEAHIPYVLRYTVDNNLGSWLEFDTVKNTVVNCEEDATIELHDLFYDLETDPADDDRILSMSYSHGGTIFHVEGENAVLGCAKEMVKSYDRFISWSGFDEDVLKKRAEINNVKVEWNNTAFVDQMFVMCRLHPKFAGRKYLGLGEAGKRLAGKGKIPMPKGIKWYHDNDKKHLEEYNNRDVELQLLIENASGLLSAWFYALEFAKIPLDYARYIAIVPQNLYLLWAQHKRTERVIVPSSRKNLAKDESIRGAAVTSQEELPCGIYSNVFSVDFKGSYVSTILAYNISPEIWDGKAFDGIGIIPEIITETTVMREKFKAERKKHSIIDPLYRKYDAMQYGMKVISLTFYGEMDRQASPLYVKEVAQYITDRSREHIAAAEECLDAEFKVKRLYKDTDSIYWVFKDDMPWTKELVKTMFRNVTGEINSAIDRMMTKRDIPQERRKITIEPQAFYSKALWAGIAKCYMLYERYTADTDEWHENLAFNVKGWVKDTNSKFALDCQHLVGRLMMDGVGSDGIIAYVKELKKLVLSGAVTEHLVLKKGLKMALDDYKTGDFIVAAAKKAAAGGKYAEKTTFYYIITGNTKHGGKIAEVVHEGELPETVMQDGLECIWSDYIVRAIGAVTAAVGLPEKILSTRLVKPSLGSFF